MRGSSSKAAGALGASAASGGICLIGSMADDEKSERSTPPGHFVSEDQRTQTARFLDE